MISMHQSDAPASLMNTGLQGQAKFSRILFVVADLFLTSLTVKGRALPKSNTFNGLAANST